jgi:hypothetical protein
MRSTIARLIGLCTILGSTAAVSTSPVLVNQWLPADEAIPATPRLLLARPGTGDFRLLSTYGNLLLADGNAATGLGRAVHEGLGVADIWMDGRMDADGTSTVLWPRGNQCRLFQHDAQLGRVRLTAVAVPEGPQYQTCTALALADDGTAFMREHGRALLHVDAAGVQQPDVPLQLTANIWLDPDALALLAGQPLVAGAVTAKEERLPWLGAFDVTGALLWSHTLTAAGDGYWRARMLTQGDWVDVLFESASNNVLRLLIKRYDAAGNEQDTGFAEAVRPGGLNFIGKFVAGGGSRVVHVRLDGLDRLLYWRAGYSEALALESPSGGPIDDYELADDGSLIVLAGTHLLRYSVSGQAVQSAAIDATLRGRKVRILGDDRVAVAATRVDGSAAVIQFNADLSPGRTDTLIGSPGSVIDTTAQSDQRVYLSTSNSRLIAVDRLGRSLWSWQWPGSSRFQTMVGDESGVWAMGGGRADRFSADGEPLASHSLVGHFHPGLLLRAFAAPDGATWVTGKSDGLGGCTLVKLTVAAVEPRSSVSGTASCSGPVGLDGTRIASSSDGYWLRYSVTGVPLWSVLRLPQETVVRLLPDNSLVLASPSRLRRVAANGNVSWDRSIIEVPDDTSALAASADWIYRIRSDGSLRVEQYRPIDGVPTGDVVVPWIHSEPVSLNRARVFPDGSLSFAVGRKIDETESELTLVSVESDLDVLPTQTWSRGASNIHAIWSEAGSIYSALSATLDGAVVRPVIIRAGEEFLVDGFE